MRLRSLYLSLCAIVVVAASGCQFLGIDNRPEIRYVTEKERKRVEEPMYSKKVPGVNMYKQWPVRLGPEYGIAPWEKKNATALAANQPAANQPPTAPQPQTPPTRPAHPPIVTPPGATVAATDTPSGTPGRGIPPNAPVRATASTRPSQAQQPRLPGAVAPTQPATAAAEDLDWRPTPPAPDTIAAVPAAPASASAILAQPSSIAGRASGISPRNPIRDEHVTPVSATNPYVTPRANPPAANPTAVEFSPDLVPPSDLPDEILSDDPGVSMSDAEAPDDPASETSAAPIVVASDQEEDEAPPDASPQNKSAIQAQLDSATKAVLR